MKSLHALRAYRDRTTITQHELAQLLHVDRVTVARWETGTRKIKVTRLQDISIKTGIPKRDLRPDIAAAFGEAAE